MFAGSDPIIESATHVTFAPYNLAYPLLDQHIEAAGLDPSDNKWDLVFDFTDTNEEGVKEKHFELLDPSEFQVVQQTVEGIEDEPVQGFPIPSKYGGTGRDNDPTKTQLQEGVVFDIKTTTAADAQKIFDEQERRRELIEAEKAKQNEPAHEEQVYDEPTHDEPVQDDFAFGEPAHEEPAHDAFSQPQYAQNNSNTYNFDYNAPEDEAININDDDNDAFASHDNQIIGNDDGFGGDFGNSDFNAHSGFDFGNTGGYQAPEEPFVEDEVPQVQIQTIPQGRPDIHGEFTSEEMVLIQAAEQAMQQRLRALRLKEDDENAKKTQKRKEAKAELEVFYNAKQREIASKRKQNKDEEWAFLNSREEHKKSKNQWEHIIDNVEIDPRKYIGNRDITRMRQAMIARKNDLKSQK